MIRPFVVMGDKTSHGGTVISADFTSDIHGKYMARVGDMVVCPKCKGVFAINSVSVRRTHLERCGRASQDGVHQTR